MYFNRKNAEQKNWRMIKKGKHFLFGCSLVFAVGASLATQTVHAETASESTVESGSKAEEPKPGYGGETGTYEAPAAVAETQPATVENAVVAENTTAKTANKEALTQLVEEVKGLDKAGKTEDSLSRLNTALEQAQNVLANAEASQDQVDAAVASLKEAETQLASKESPVAPTAAEDRSATEDRSASSAETATPAEPVRSRGKRDLSSRAAYRSVDGSVAEGEFAGAGVKQFQSVRYSVDGNKTTWTIDVVPQHKRHLAAGLVVASDDTIESITVIDRGPNAGRLEEDYYVEKDFGKLPAMSNHKALASHYKTIGGGIPDSLTYRVVTKGTKHNLFARFATAIVKKSLENGGMNGSSAVKNRTSDFPEVGINLSSRLAPKPGVNNTYTQTNDTITVPTVASTDETLTGTGKPGATINIKVNGRTARQVKVAADGRWTFPLEIGLNSNVTGGAQLVPANKISVSQTVNGQESGDTDVNVSLGHSEILPSSKSKQQNNLVENDRNVTLKVPHDAGAAYFQFTDTNGKSQEVGLKRDAVPGKWQVNSSSSAIASVASSEDGKFYSTINLTLNKDMKAGTTARVISNMQEGSYSSLQGWQSRNVEAAPKEETPAPQPQPQPQPQPEPSKPITPAVDGATTAPASAPEIVNDLAGKASTPADVTVKAPAGSTVKLYNKDGVVIGEAVANDKGVATVHPTNSLPEGEITATSTPAGGTESAKSAPITVTKTPTPYTPPGQTNGPYKLQMATNTTQVTVHRGDHLSLTGAAAGTALRFFGITAGTANNIQGVKPAGGLATNGSARITQSNAKAEGTVAWTQPLGDTTIVFRAEGSPDPTSSTRQAIERKITVTVIETTKKYDPVAGTKVDIANPNNVSEDEKNKIIDSVKTANPSLPAGSQYSVDEKGNLTITYPDGSTDKVAAAYLVTPAKDTTAPDQPVVNTDLTGKAGTKTPVEVTAEKGSTVALYDKDNNKIGEATAGENGKATITPKVDIPAGPVTAKATDAAGNESKPSVAKVATDTTAPAKPVVNTDLTGKAGTKTPVEVSAEPGSTVALYDKDNNKIGEGTAGSNGKVTITPKVDIPAGNVTAKATDAAGNTSDASNPKVATDTTAPAKPVVNTDLTGKAGTKTPVEVTAEKGSTVALYDKNNNKIGEATAGANGKATITPKVDIPAGNVTAKATDAAGNTSVASDPKVATPARENVAPTVEIPYSDPAPNKKEVYLYTGEEADVEITFNDDSGKIKSASLKKGGNIALNNIDGNPEKQDNEFGYTVTAINSETPTPAKIKVTGKVSGLDDRLPKTESDSLELVTRFATATDTDGALINNTAVKTKKNGEVVGSYLTDPGAVTFVLKAQTKKYDIKTPAAADKVTVSDANNVTDKEFEKIKEKVKVEYSQNNPDARLADKKGKEVEDASKVVDKVEKEGNKVVVTYKDGSKDTKPLSEFVNVAPTVELPYSNEAKKEIYVYTGENTDLTFKASDNTAVKDMYVRGPGGIGKDNTADYGFTTGKIENSAVTHGDGTVSGATATIKMTGVTTLKAPNHWTSFVVANDNDNAPSNTDFNALDKNPNATQTPGYVHFIVKSQTDKYDIATPAPADKVEVADPTNVTNDDLDKIKEKLKLEYNKKNDDANIAKDTPVDKNGKIQSVKKDDKGNLVVTYTDGSTDTKPLSEFVTKKPKQADKNEPTPKAQTVDKGTEPKAEDSIGNLKDLPKGTTVAFKEPVDTATPGEKPATVVVTYPDGSTDEVPVKVTVQEPSSEPKQADKNEPTPKAQTVDKGTEPKAEDSIGNLKDLPKGTTVAFKEPVDTATPGEKPATVVVTYPDGSTDEVPVKVTVQEPSSEPKQADKNEPTPKAQTVDKGTEPKAEDSIGNLKDLPKGTTVAFKEPVDTATPGEKPATVVVTYPDGSTDEVPVKVTVQEPSSEPKQADKNEPTPKAQTVDKGTEPKAEDSIGNLKDLPKGTTVAFKEPVDTATPGEKPATVVVTYPDGSTDEVPVKVTVQEPSSEPKQADKNEPTPKAQTVDKGTEPKAEDSIGNLKDLPKGTTVAFKEPVDTATPGEKPATVVVTYPDGSTDEVPVKVTVQEPSSEPKQADKNEPTPKAQTVDKGTEPKAEDSIGNLKDLPKGTTVAFKEPVDTATPGEKPATVVVTYPDGSTDEVPVKVTVQEPSSEPKQADKNEPTPKAQTVDKGTEPKAEDSIGNLKDLPKGTTVAFKEPVDTATPGEKPATVVVTYPDGSTDEVPVKVTVQEPSSEPKQADKNEPTPKAQTVDKGTEPKAEDSIGNLKDLPKGTTVAFKEPVDTATPGEKPATVVVTYPDGSTDEVPVKVTVQEPSSEPKQADKNEPTPKAQTVDKGTEPKAEDSIGNLKDLPKGTTVAFKDPVDTTTPGEKPATAVVTYPDGSKEEVPVKVTVTDPSSKPTDADKNEPTPKAQTVDKGTEPKAEDSIGNLKDLPKGTTVAFKDPVDTTTPGEKPATAVVTYPDGSKEEVPVKVTVTDPSSKPTDADKNEPTPKAQTVDKGTEPKAEDSIGNLKDLPKGTTVAFKDPVDTTTPGEKPATAVVTYPDGSKEEVPVKVTVTDPSSKPTDADKNEPTPKAQTVDKGTEPKAEDSIGNLKDLPKGTTVAFKDPVDTTTPGEKPATAVVTYPDGSKEEVPVKVTVTDPSSKPTDADKNEPTPKAQTVDKGTEPKAEDSIGNLKDLPKGTTVAFKDPVDTTTPGEKPATAVVTYPDGSKEEVPVKVTVTDPSSKPTDADKNEPTPKAQTVDKGTEPKAEDSIGNLKDLPKGTTVEFKTPVDTTTPGEKPATAVVTYPDGSKDEVPVKVTVKDPSAPATDADKNTPVAKDQTVKPGEKPKAEDSIDNLKDLPKGTTVEFKTPVDTTTPGDKPATAVVTYPDGSKDEVPVKVTVKDPSAPATDADKNTPVAKDQTVKPGEKPKAEDSIDNLKDLPKGTTVEFKTPVDTTTPGDKPATAVVTYPDGSKEEVPVKVTVKDPSAPATDADKNTPVAKDQTVKPGEKPKAEDSIDNLKDLPKGTTVEFKTPVDTTTPGDKPATAVVTYPDGSKEEVPVKVTVKDPSAPATDADKNTPVAKDQTVKPGEKPKAEDSIDNLKDLPKGTTVEFKTPVDTTTPGEKPATAVVTYPDGSKEEVPVKVTVTDPSSKPTDADKNEPTPKAQTVDKGTEPKAEDSIGNLKDLPKGTTVEFKTPVDTTTPGEKPATAVVTYPDGSKDEVPVKVTVKDPSAPATDADKNTPVAKDQTVKPGEKPKAEDSIDNLKDLPKGTTVEFKTPVDTTTPGDKPATAVVTYPDGSKDEVPVKVTVKDPSAPATDADKNTPVAKDQTVKPGEKPKAEDSIDNLKDLPKGTTVEFKTPVDTTTPGDKDATVVVTYPDGSKDEVPVKVTVKDPSAPATDADKNTPTAKDQTVKPGDKPSAKDSIGNVGDLPKGTTVEFKTPVDTTTPGDKGTTVVVTYPDGSKDEVPVKVTVKDPEKTSDADNNTPTAKDQTVKPGDKPSAKDSIGNVGDLPEGTTVEFKTPVDTTTPGDKDATVVVTYPDGSKDEVPVKVTVKDPSAPATDADKNTPTAKDQTVKPGDKPSAKDSIGNVGDLPKGTTVEFKTPVDTTTPGDKDATVVVTYPDGSKDEVPVKVTVKDPEKTSDADKNTPTAKDQTVKPGDKPSAKDSIGNVGDLPEGTTVEFKTPVDTTTPGDKDATVVVTYPDGSKDEVPVKVTVKDPSAPATDADKNTPTAKDQTVKPGDKPSAKDSIGNVGDLPKGTTVEFKTPVDTTTPGDKGTTVVVTYPDGSKDEVPVKVTVKDPEKTSDADKNTPTAKDQTVKPGDKPSAKDSIGNVGDLPEGTTVEFKTPVDTTTPGDKDATVVVTYPDGSKDEVPVKVTVKDPEKTSDADNNTPTAKDQTVKPGDKPSAKDSIGNVGDLPEGTTVEFKTPVDTTTPGDKDATVVVTYPDGSKDEVPVKVTVKDPSAPATDADKNTPTAKDQTVKPGDKPSAKDSIGNVGDLPKGTTVEFKTPVDTTTPGDKGTTVVVTYPDGSKDEVPVKVTVKDPSAPATDADKNTPTAKDQTVKPGDKPSAKDSIGNVGDLPKGTTVEFKTPVDTTTPGDKGTTVVVTYPDGSKDEVPVKVTVKDPSAPATDADKNTPTAKDQTVKPGDKPSAKDSIGNVGDLPKGTTVEFKTPVDTTTPGDKGTTVVVTYPDGSKDEVPVKVTVKDPTNKVVKDPSVTPVTDPSNLTDAEKAKVADEVKKANPTAKDIKVNNDGSVVVTFEDGTTAVIPADKTVKKSSDKVKESDGVKNPSVTPVTDPSNLTDAEKAKVADEVKKANPTAKDIKVNNDGSVVVTFEDGSVAVIPAEKAVTAANQDSPAQAPAKKAGAKELPNTGTEQSSASLALALLAAATGGLLFAKKREEEE